MTIDFLDFLLMVHDIILQ